MTVNITVDVGADQARNIAQNIRTLTGLRVLVGIATKDDPRPPPEGAARTYPTHPVKPGDNPAGYAGWMAGPPKSNIGNAALGYIHEHGSPINNIPPRPWLVPGVKLSKDAWLPYLERAATKALENASLIDIEKELGKAGFKAVEGVQRRMQAHIPPPLAASTVRNRRRRSKGSSYRRKALMPGDTTPLIDTGELIKHISWVLQKEGEDVATGTREIGA